MKKAVIIYWIVGDERKGNKWGQEMSYDIFQGVESVKYITGSDRTTGARCIGRHKEPPDRQMFILIPPSLSASVWMWLSAVIWSKQSVRFFLSCSITCCTFQAISMVIMILYLCQSLSLAACCWFRCFVFFLFENGWTVWKIFPIPLLWQSFWY